MSSLGIKRSGLNLGLGLWKKCRSRIISIKCRSQSQMVELHYITGHSRATNVLN